MRTTTPRNRWDLIVPDRASTWIPTRSVSICIPVRDGGASLRRTLSALSLQTYPHHLLDVVVADDSSRPPLELDEHRCEFDLNVVRQDVDGFGAGRARNLAADAARGEILMFLDADVVPEPQVVEAYARWFERSTRLLVFGFSRFVDMTDIDDRRLLDGLRSGTLGDLFRDDDVDDQEWRERYLRRTHDLRDERSDMFRVVVGATLAVDAEQFRSIGGFRPVGKRGIEDIEFGYRAQRSGWFIVPDRDARHWHQGARTMSGERIERIRQERQPYAERLLPVGGFRTGGTIADAPVPVVPRLHVVVEARSTGDVDAALASVRRHGGPDVTTSPESGYDGPNDDAHATVRMPSTARWSSATTGYLFDALDRHQVGTVLALGDTPDETVVVQTARARLASSDEGVPDDHAARRLHGVWAMTWAGAGIDSDRATRRERLVNGLRHRVIGSLSHLATHSVRVVRRVVRRV